MPLVHERHTNYLVVFPKILKNYNIPSDVFLLQLNNTRTGGREGRKNIRKNLGKSKVTLKKYNKKIK